MKKQSSFFVGALAVLCLFSACTARGTSSSNASSTAETVSSQPESVLSEPIQESSAAPSSISSSAESLPAPELSDTEQQILLGQLKGFANIFGQLDSLGTPADLSSEQILQFCMAQADSQKDLYGYYFELDGTSSLIPSAVIEETAQRSFGLESFSDETSDLYDENTDCYRYTPGEVPTLKYAVSSPKGASEDGIAYEVEYLDEQGETTHTLLFTFQLGRINGMPYLQLRSIAALSFSR